MSRLKSSLLCAALLAGLLGFANRMVSAQATADVIPHPPPRALAQAQKQPAGADAGGNAQVDNAQTAAPGPEQRVALVIGNSNYRNAARLANPGNDAQAMAEFLSAAGFEVISATNLTRNDMIRVVQDFAAELAARGPNTTAMIYYAGHGVQLEGENYLIPVDAKVASPSELVGDSLRLVDVMATLEAIPSRVRIVMLDACRNNPFPSVVDAGRGLAIVDAPNGSIVGYSTAPGTEAQDGSGGHSPYTSAFLRLAHEPNLPIEQLFKRVRLDVNHATDGVQTPWESSSLTSEFYFFGDTAMAAARTPEHGSAMQMASNLPMRSVRQAYDYVLSEGSPAYYQEFIQMFPRDPLCERIRALLGYLLQAAAWHQAVLENSSAAYKSFYDKYSSSPYALSALKLQSQPKAQPLLQPTHLIVPPQLAPALTVSGTPKYNLNVRNIGSPGPDHPPLPGNGPAKIVILPAQGSAAANGGKIGPGETVGNAAPPQELTEEPKGDRIPGKPDFSAKADLSGKADRPSGKGDRLPIIEQRTETRRPSRIDTPASGRGKSNGPAAMRDRRQMGIAPGMVGGMVMENGFGRH